MNYDPRWSNQYPQPMYYPPQQPVAFIPMPQNKTEADSAFEMMKKIRKELRKEGVEKAKGEKPKEEKKKPALTYLECVAIVFMSGPFVMLIYGGIIFTTAKVIKSLL